MKQKLQETTSALLKHALLNFVTAVVIIVCAVGVSMLEQWCEKEGLPAYLTLGMRVIAIMLFITDAIVICGTARISLKVS